MFFFKKFVSAFLFPVPLITAILISGVLFLWFTKRQRTGKVLVSLGTLLLLLLGYERISDQLLRGLEYRYRPLAATEADVRTVVVLGGGGSCDGELPVANQLSAPSLFRLMEGVLLYRGMKDKAKKLGGRQAGEDDSDGCKLVLSGGGAGDVKVAETMAKVAVAIGVPGEDLILETESWDTQDEARLIKPIVQNDPFILVTSASHMPRAMLLFEKQGTHPFPAPAEYLVDSKDCEGIGVPELPSVQGLRKATTAFYEVMGLGWEQF